MTLPPPYRTKVRFTPLEFIEFPGLKSLAVLMDIVRDTIPGIALESFRFLRENTEKFHFRYAEKVVVG